MPAGHYIRTKQTLQKYRLNNLGKKLSQEIKDKISKSKKGQTYNKGKKRSEEFKEKCRKRMLGKYKELAISYKKDRTLLKKSENKMLNSAYMQWSKDIKNRDKWKCKLLNNECKGRLEAHHIFNWIEYPELRYLLTNGITLCQFQHPKGREKEKRMIPIFQELLSVSKE
jgi:hypothetical protein